MDMKYLLLILAFIAGVTYGLIYSKPVSYVQKAALAFEETPRVSPSPSPVTTDVIVKAIVEEFKDVPKADLVRAINIAYCESGIRAEAKNQNTNGTEDSSVFQVNDVHIKTFGSKFKTDWKENIKVARKIYDRHDGSFSAWVCNSKI